MLGDSMRVWIVGGTPAVTSMVSEAAEALGAAAVGAATPAAVVAHAEHRDCVVVASADREADVGRTAELARAGLAPLVVCGERGASDAAALFGAGARDVLVGPLHKRELILRLSAALHRKLRIACLGGGTGLFTVLMALKELPRTLLSAIVTMSDDGGSSGRLRATFGVLPPGDVRRSLVALANAPEVMSFLMQYRFASGDGLTGHSLGNLLLTALSELAGSMQGAVQSLGDVLNVQGLVRCVTDSAVTLCAEFEDGRIVRGESAIDLCLERPSGLRIQRVWHEPRARTNDDVVASLLSADVIVLGPGDLYTSVLAGLLVDGVPGAIRASKAVRVYVCNLMTKPGETEGYDVADHVRAVVEAIGGDVLDHVLVSSTALDPNAVRAYGANGQHPVKASPPEVLRAVTRANLVPCDVGHHEELVRHDPAKLRSQIAALVHARRPSLAAPPVAY
jgi:uncharacterized cofD-like protein